MRTNSGHFARYLLTLTRSGTTSNIISGLNLALQNVQSTGNPSVVNLSWGGAASTAVDAAVTALVSAGAHVVIAAGNTNTDAATTSPARVATAITVGAINITDAKASFSNYGSVVDLYAPGVSITGAGWLNSSASAIFSGTSQAAPHVTGVAAVYIALFGNLPPAQLVQELWSQTGRITGLRTSIELSSLTRRSYFLRSVGQHESYCQGRVRSLNIFAGIRNVMATLYILYGPRAMYVFYVCTSRVGCTAIKRYNAD